MDWAAVRARYVRAHRAEFAEVLGDMAAVVQSLIQQLDPVAAADVFDRGRWDAALRDRIYQRNRLTAVDVGGAAARGFGSVFESRQVVGFLDTSARLSAEKMNAATEDQLQEALVGDGVDAAVAAVFDRLLGQRVAALAASTVQIAGNLATVTAAEQAGRSTKTWRTTSANPRSTHTQMDGETVPVGDDFSNGMRWPGDPRGGVDEVAGCQCHVVIDEGGA